MNVNRVVIVGRLTKDIEVSKTQSGISVTKFTVAVNRSVKDMTTGEYIADFIPCIAWRQSADYLGQYGKKGNEVSVDGKIQVNNYTSQSGEKRTYTEVVADNVSLTREKKEQYQETTEREYTNQYAYDDVNPALNEQMDITNDDLPF